MEEKLNGIHKSIIELYPDAVSVDILVTNEHIKVVPQYRTNANGYSMRKLNGEWIRKANKR
jgi:hypothetical protein